MARATDYSISPGSAPTAFTKSEGGAVFWAPGLGWIWSVVCEIKQTASGPQIGEVALSAATEQAINLNTAFPSTAFPENVQCGQAYIKRVTDFAGGSATAVTAEVGDAADDNELVTALDVFTGAVATQVYEDTPSAANYAMHIESAYVPLLTLTVTGDNVDDLTAGSVVVCIPFRPLHD